MRVFWRLSLDRGHLLKTGFIIISNFLKVSQRAALREIGDLYERRVPPIMRIAAFACITQEVKWRRGIVGNRK